MIHIHNGDLVAEAARRSGIDGEHLPFRETLATGPVPRDVDLETRAQFLASASHEHLLRIRNGLIDQERALDAAMTHDEVVLWFEHDLFCLVNLLKMIDRFAAHRRLTLIWCPEPLSNEDLLLRFESRAAVTPAMIKAAREAWEAYTSPDPTGLNRFVSGDSRDFPFLRDGLTLHASRFPSTLNGLGIVEQRLLDSIGIGTSDFLAVFSRFDPGPPRLGFGDSEAMRVLRVLSGLAVPLVTMTEEPGRPPKALFTRTPAADNVLRGEVDYVKVNDPDYWLGGVHITREKVWRWDADRRAIVAS
jgi:hypothetical protein